MATPTVTFTLNGVVVEVPAEGTLLTALRERLPQGVRPVVSVKDGCAPQGQCGCCTVWVDGEARVSCVTPVARVAGRSVTTLEGVDESVRTEWSSALCATGGSQCGFCTPGIIMRLENLRRDSAIGESEFGSSGFDSPGFRDAVNKSLLAHMCRCTGWQTIHDAVDLVTGSAGHTKTSTRDLSAASRRADMEGHSHQTVHPRISLGDGGFAEDIAPKDALVAVPNAAGEWILGPDVASARRAAGSVQGRKSTVPVSWPVGIDMDHPGANGFVRTLATTWVEPAYLEPDAVWCSPGGEPIGPLVNGGAFGGKSDPRFVEDLRSAARRLADERGRTVRVVLSREDVVRRGPKRPPMALGVRGDGSGVLWAVRTPGLRDVIARVAPDWELIEVDVAGPATSMSLRAAGWAEIAIARCSVREPVAVPGSVTADRGVSDVHLGDVHPGHVIVGDHVIAPNGAEAWARVETKSEMKSETKSQTETGSSHDSRERIVVRVSCGDPLDETVLRSYCIGAAHMALGWVRSEGIAVTANSDGTLTPVDLTIRSFGVLRAVDTPDIVVEIDTSAGDRVGHHDSTPVDFTSVNGSDAVFAAVAAAVWRHDGFPPAWPSRR
jgi:aerobic-type carbon monoxide dehydrogenase small subunit (CoxS/CutS family)